MSPGPRIAVSLLLVASMLVAGVALGQSDDKVAAGETFHAATEAYNRGDFEAAARSFEVSYRLAPHPNTAYNAGLAWQAAGRLARAADAFTLAVAMDGISAEQRADAESRLAEINPQLSIVHIVAPPGTRVTLAHAKKRVAPASIHVAPGEYVLTSEFSDGRTIDQKVKATTSGGEVNIEVAAPASSPTPAPGNTSPTPRPAPDPMPDDDATTRNQAQWISGWVLVGASVVSGGVAIGLGVGALQAKDEFEASGNTDREARDEAATLRTTTNVMWAAAGAFAVTGVLLLVFSNEDEDASADQALRVSVSPGWLGLSGAF
jgi:hypothetical protein